MTADPPRPAGPCPAPDPSAGPCPPSDPSAGRATLPPVPPQAPESAWECGRCGVPLEIGTVKAAYLETEQPVDLWRCPRCGTVLVPEDLALGRILQVEQLLEDK
ncbi:MAG TPA: hypothetical protein VFP72_22365 [Kineosporiaceae bacterium]|nr:hypothetical protein [Kineosporiaceae bacterium]